MNKRCTVYSSPRQATVWGLCSFRAVGTVAAISIYLLAFSFTPVSAEVDIVARLQGLNESGEHAAAIAAAEAWLDKNPGRRMVYVELARAHKAMGNRSAVLEVLLRGGLVPNADNPAYTAGVKHLEARDLESAISEFERAIREVGENVPERYFFALGRSHELRCDWRRARSAFEEAAKRGGVSREPARQAGQMRLRAQLSSPLEERLSRDPVAEHVGCGRYLMTIGDVEGALRRFHAAVAVRPGDPDAQHQLGLALIELGREADADAALAEAARLAPDRGWPTSTKQARAFQYAERGRLALAKTRSSEAIVAYEKALELIPGVVEWQCGLAKAYRYQLDEDRSSQVHWARICVEGRPADSRAHSDYGFAIMQSNGDLSEAESALRTAVVLNPRNGAAHELLGRLLERKGSLAGALAHYRAALDLSPMDPMIENTVKRLETDLGEAAGAKP